jgi:CO/xanthine dehydrogenase Mo-binding subunit
LTVYEPSQYVYGVKNGLAEQLGLDPADVRVVSRYVGGAFGSKAFDQCSYRLRIVRFTRGCGRPTGALTNA